VQGLGSHPPPAQLMTLKEQEEIERKMALVDKFYDEEHTHEETLNFLKGILKNAK